MNVFTGLFGLFPEPSVKTNLIRMDLSFLDESYFLPREYKKLLQIIISKFRPFSSNVFLAIAVFKRNLPF